MRLSSSGIVNLDHDGNKSYASVVLGYSKVNLLVEREDAALCPSVNYIRVIYGVTVSDSVCRQMSLFSILLGILHQNRHFFFLVFNFS